MDILALKAEFRESKSELIKLEIPVGWDTLDAVTTHLPGGAYTTLRTYDHNKVIRLEDYLGRLEEIARTAHKQGTLERHRLREVLRNVIDEYPGDMYLRIRVVLDLEYIVGEIYIMSEILKTQPPSVYHSGVR